MNIAILSGKGGTGKTTVSTNLALALNANYVDCDVEEPNGFIFLNPKITKIQKVTTDYPIINENKCNLCGLCAMTCQFNALSKVNEDIILFPKLCHGCEACSIVCESKAISYGKREIGKIEKGQNDIIKCMRGIINIGEPMAVPIIKKLLASLEDELNIIDCPPGTSCNVVSALKYADGAVLITEPTVFGKHDLELAVELVKMFSIPFGVIINKDSRENNIIREYCIAEDIKIVGSIPYSREVSKAYSKGELLYQNPKYTSVFEQIVDNIGEVIRWK